LRIGRSLAGPDDLRLLLLGAAGTIGASYLAVVAGLKIGVLSVAVLALLVGSVIAYLKVPHLAVSVTVVLFAFLEGLKVFISPSLGGVKDVMDLGAIVAMLLLVLFEHRRPDVWVGRTVMLLLALYVINPGHSHDTAWAQGVRLIGEPLLLLLVGFVLPEPRRNLRYAMIALIATGCAVSFYGLIQQLLGPARLVSLGYSYTAQVRMIGSFLRSFGTFDDPFAYAAYILFALAGVIFWLRRSAIAWVAGIVLFLGLGASLVRTGLLVGVAYLAMQMIRWRHPIPAVAFLVAAAIAGSFTLLGSTGTETTSFTIYTRGGGSEVVQGTAPASGGNSVLLNGRVSAWTAAVGTNPINWIFGRGVGKVGTAAARAQYTFVPTSSGGQTQAVDSGYFATVADIGLIGLIVQLVMFGRLLTLGARGARAGRRTGWVALGLIICMMLDAATRASFTGFPTAFVGMLLVGIALAADQEQAGAQAPATTR
jgi:hypothetical protein